MGNYLSLLSLNAFDKKLSNKRFSVNIFYKNLNEVPFVDRFLEVKFLNHFQYLNRIKVVFIS